MINVAIIGVGIMGSLHARVYSELSNVKLVGICDINRIAGKKLADLYKTKFYEDYEELLSKEKLDGVSITVPTILHTKIALYCIRKGVNILIEKPLAQTVKDAASIVDAAKKKKIYLTVGHVERFNPAVVKLKEFIQKKYFGEIVSIAIKRVGLFPPRIRDVNVVTDLAVHDLDIVCALLDKFPKNIFATGGKGISPNQLDYTDIFMDLGGTSCYIQVNWITPIKIRTLSITGTLGYAELDYITQELTLYKSNPKISVPQQFEKFVTKLSKTKKISVNINKQEPLRLEIKSFLEGIKNKKVPEVSGEQGIAAVRLTEIVLKSLKDRKLIKVT